MDLFESCGVSNLKIEMRDKEMRWSGIVKLDSFYQGFGACYDVSK